MVELVCYNPAYRSQDPELHPWKRIHMLIHTAFPTPTTAADIAINRNLLQSVSMLMYINPTQSKMHVGTCVVDAPCAGAVVDADTSEAQWISSSTPNGILLSFNHSCSQKLQI